MSNIKELVKAAIEEFGERAFERFWYPLGDDSFLMQDNEMLISILQDEKDCTDLELLPLPELFAHGVKFYGFEQEVKMWEWMDHEGVWHDTPELACYDEIIDGMSEYPHRRKTSAALPFDLERAKAGDVVENYHETYKQWQVMSRSCIFEMKKYTNKVSEYYVRVQLCEGASIALKADNLRMKYPKKVQFGAWNAKT